MANTTSEPAEQVMPGSDTPSTEIVKRAAASPVAVDRVPLMTDDEIRRCWRLASSLAASGMFKDARQAEQAFGKILYGRDLGLSPTQAMSGLHIVEGKVETAAVMMGNFIRAREGYDYRAAWIKETPAARQGERAVREVVYLDEDTASDLRPVVGCAIEFTVDGKLRGVSPFTQEDALKAGLASKKNYQGYPRNMFFARAMSNGCKWLVPEVLNGLPVYVEGEIEAQKALGDGDGDGVAAGLDMGPDVEKVIARATDLGHAALSNRATIEMQLGDQPPAYVVSWVKAAKAELDAIPPDAEVVISEPKTDADRSEPIPASVAERQAEAYEAVAGVPVQDPPDPERIEALRRRGEELLNDAEALRDAGDPRAGEAFEEAERIMAQVDAASDPAQERWSL